MSKYIKVFDTVEEYNAYSGGTAFTSPNISYIKNTDETKYDDNEIKHYTEKSWIGPIDIETITGTTFGSLNKYISNVEIPSGVTSIGDNAFNNCNSLTSVTIPSGVTNIGGYAFSNCNSLTSVTIPSSVTSIGGNAFYYCISLASIDLPSGVTSINYNAFNNCSSLASVDLPSGVISIGNSAFSNCRSLTSVTIPSGVTSIGNNAFNNCSSLASVTVNATTPPTLGSGAFTYTHCSIYVASESVEAYKTATNWSAYADRIQPIPTE